MISHDFEKPALTSYPLKVAVLHEAEAGRGCSKDGLYLSALRILKRVDTLGPGIDGSSLTNVFMKHDPVFKEPERSHLEARRIAITIKYMDDLIFQHGAWHTLFFVLLFAFNIGNIFLIDTVMRTYPGALNYSLACESVMAINLFISVSCVVWITGYKCLSDTLDVTKMARVLYRVNSLLLFYHVIFLISSILDIVCLVRILYALRKCRANKVPHEDCIPKTSMLYILSMMSTCTTPLVLTLHVLVVGILTGCRCIKHRWEWVFTDLLCRSICCPRKSEKPMFSFSPCNSTESQAGRTYSLLQHNNTLVQVEPQV